MNKKAISILLTAAMGVSVLAAGTVTVSAAEKKDKYVIGMSQCNLGEPWRVAMNDQIAMAAEKHPEFEVIFADAAQDNSKQIADIENFVQMGVDLIITSPNEATPLTNAVSAAYDAGILQIHFFLTVARFVRSKVLKELLVESTEIMVSAKVSRKMTRLKS